MLGFVCFLCVPFHEDKYGSTMMLLARHAPCKLFLAKNGKKGHLWRVVETWHWLRNMCSFPSSDLIYIPEKIICQPVLSYFDFPCYCIAMFPLGEKQNEGITLSLCANQWIVVVTRR